MQVSRHSEYKLLCETPKVKLAIVPTVNISAKKFILKKKNNINAEITDASVTLRLLPLLTGRLHINKFTGSNIKIIGTIDKNTHLNKDFINKIENATIKTDCINVKSLEVNVRKQNIISPIIYNAKNIIYKKTNRYMQFFCDSVLNVSNKKSDIKINLFFPKNNDINKTIFDIKISNLYLSPFKTYYKYFVSDELADLSGKIEILGNTNGINMIFDDCKIIMKDFAKSIIFPKQMSIKSKFKIKYDSINFEDVTINSDKIHISFSGKIGDYMTKQLPKLNLNININKSRLEDIANLLPPFAIEEIDVYKLKKYKFYADIVGNLTIRGRLPEPDINGNVLITNGILVKPILRAKRGAIAKLAFIGKYMNYDVQVAAGGNENVSVIGGVELYNVKFADMVISTTENVDLKVTSDVLNPLHQILNFIIGPVPILDIYGKGNLNITVKGNRKLSHITGIMNFKNTTVNFKELDGIKLKNANAILKFEDENFKFKTLSGTVNGKDFKIEGTCNMAGKFNFNVLSKNQPTAMMYKAIQKSSLVKDIKNMIPQCEDIQGLMDLNSNIYGNLKYIEDLKFGENVFVKGSIQLKNNTVKIFDNVISNIFGKINFDMANASVALRAKTADAPLKINAKINNDIADIIMDIPRINPNYYTNEFLLFPQNILPVVSTKIKYKGSIANINYDKINLYAKIIEPDKNSEFKIQSGEVYLQNGTVRLNEIKGYIKQPQNKVYINLTLDKAFSEKICAKGNVNIKAFDTRLINEMKYWKSIPQNVKQRISDYDFKNGIVNLNCNILNNKYNSEFNLENFEFKYLPLDMPVKIINGNLLLKNNNLYTKKINILADKMPVLIDGKIDDVFDTQKLDIYLSAKPQQEFIDKYINKKQIYPIKIKGDITVWSKILGTKKDYNLVSSAKFDKGAGLYAYGASIGDVENDILLSSDIKVLPEIIKINYLMYDKLIESQNGKLTRLNLLRIFGSLIRAKEICFKDLHIKTTNPTDARIFNIIFRKPNIKEGQFLSDIKINGKISSPKILGEFHIFETNIPFLDTTMKNIELIFRDKFVTISSRGDVVGNKISLKANMRNKFTKPYYIENAELYTQDLNFNNIVEKIKKTQMDEDFSITPIFIAKPEDFIFDNVKIYAENIELRNIHAKDVIASVKLNQNGILNISDFNFNLANGNISGNYFYNMKNNDIKLMLDAQSISANDISIALFDLNNQIYGDMTGKVELSCNGTNYKSCMKTLNGETTFSVKDGKMPKLGSLEYLLKAGNLVKSGITGMSINGVVDLITPLKTGNFSSIMGSIKIKNGIANNIEIITQGKDLSMYIAGSYDCSTSNADMQVLGMLTRKISTMLGPIGNLSINTLFNLIPGIDLSQNGNILTNINKIPGLELSNKAYRKFVAQIFGNINGDNYVSSFMWIN